MGGAVHGEKQAQPWLEVNESSRPGAVWKVFVENPDQDQILRPGCSVFDHSVDAYEAIC